MTARAGRLLRRKPGTVKRSVARLAVMALIAAGFITLTATGAAADAADVTSASTSSVVVNADGSITIRVQGTWAWTTRHDDCNVSRYAVGWAIDWNDPTQPGNEVGTLGAVTIDVGAADANAYNPADNLVRYYPGPNPPRCGTFNDPPGYNTGTWGASPDQTGGFSTHTYPPGTNVIAPCAVTYDVHNAGGQNPPTPPIKVGDLIAGGLAHNDDNSVQENGQTPAGNVCAPVLITPNLTTTSNPTGNTPAGVLATDTANVVPAGATGSISFFLCGPGLTTAANATTGCPTGGTKIGGDITLAAGTATSAATTAGQTASVGLYCWRAVYNPSGVFSTTNHTNNTTECFTVVKNSPTIATTLSSLVPVVIGTPVHDSSALTGATATAGGTVTYTVYTNNTCTANPVDAGTKTVTNAVVPDSDPITFNNAGTFYWQAVYSGDASNNTATSLCTSEILTVNPNQPTIATTLSSLVPVPIGTPVHDSSALTGATATAGGTVTYTVYTNNTCTANPVTAGTKTVTNGVVPDSDNVTFNNAGTFYWQAVYSGDANNNTATSVCTSEILTVLKNSPSITTLLSSLVPVPIGTPVHDSSTLTGATATAGGTVTYTVYTNNTCTANPVTAGTKTVTNGVVPNSDNVTFNNAGTFYWQAVYSGDPNNNAATSVCTTEILTVNKNSPSITTLLSSLVPVAIGTPVHDSSTLTGATATAGGTVTYTVYTNNTCTANPVTAGTKTVTNGVVPDSDNVTFNNAGTFYWQAVYSGDANNNGATSVCTTEILTVFPNAPSITTLLSSLLPVPIGTPVHDSSTITGATATAGGTVTYTVYTNNTCTTGAIAAGIKNVTNGVVPDSNNVTFNSAGTFYWQAVYSGDANNLGATSLCTSEILIVDQNATSITTTLSSLVPVAIGTPVHDSSTLAGVTANAGGTVTYTVYTNNTCTAGAVAAGTKTVTNGVVPDSNAIQFNNAGTFYWQAVYSGDANNIGSMSVCTSEILIVNPNSPSIATTLSSLVPVAIGTSVHDSSALTGATATAGGTVTYTVYTNNTCTANPVTAGTKTVTNGVVPDSNAIQFNNAGTFYWQAVYSGDANNNGATSVCTSEILTVMQNAPSITTTLSSLVPVAIGTNVHDSSVITGATATAGGTVTYTVYTNNTCTTGAVAAGTKTVTNGVVPDSNNVQFNNAGTFYWQAVYTGDANNLGATSLCTSEILVVNKNSPSITTTLSSLVPVPVTTQVHDSSTITGATATAGGTVTYTVYTNNTCSAGAIDAGTKNVTNGVVPDSNNVTFNTAGTFYWQAVYSGDANNNGATSVCTTEILTVERVSSSTVTDIHNASHQVVTTVRAGTTVHDLATVTGGIATPTGTATFEWFTNGTCTGTAISTSTPIALNGSGVADATAFAFTPQGAGNFAFRGTYSGDDVHLGSIGACEPLVVTLVDLSIVKTASVVAVAPGGAFSYTFSVDNLGPSDATADATVTDVLPTDVSFVSFGTLPAGVNCTPPVGKQFSCTIAEGLLDVADPPVLIVVNVTESLNPTIFPVINKVIVTSPDDVAPCVVTPTNITCTPPTTNNYSEVSTGVTLPAVVVVPAAAQPIAFTGVDSQRMLGFAAILIGLGGLLLIVARRRRQQGLT